MTRSIVLIFVSLAMSALLAGCLDTRGGGPRPMIDSGPDDTPGRDAGPIVLMDSGPLARCGDGSCTSSESCSSCPSDCGSCSGTCGDGSCSSSESCSSCPSDCGPCGPTCGDGSCGSSESCSSCPSDCGPCTSCRSNPVPRYPGIACSSTTRTCAEACTDGTCINDCLMADPSPDCFACVQQNLVSCFNAAGCQSDWDCYTTCYEDAGCTGGAACTACASELEAYNSCVDSVSGSCTDWVSCLP